MESRFKLVDIEDQLAQLPTNLEFTEDTVLTILSQVKALNLESESIGELEKITNELYKIYKNWNDDLWQSRSLELLQWDNDSPLYTDHKYNEFHKLKTNFLEVIFKSASRRMYELMKTEWIRTSSYQLLSNIEDVVNAANVSREGFSGVRNIINFAMVNYEADLDPNMDWSKTFNDAEREQIQKLQAEMRTMEIIYDSQSITTRQFQNFKLLFDDVGYQSLMTKTLSDRARHID